MADTYPSLFWGYLAIWLLLSCYILFLGLRLRKAEKDLQKRRES
jgi:CcmD family protein